MDKKVRVKFPETNLQNAQTDFLYVLIFFFLFILHREYFICRPVKYISILISSEKQAN
jgi:hypothetical protein